MNVAKIFLEIQRRRASVTLVVLGAWATAVMGGWCWLISYGAQTNAPVGLPVNAWPESSQIRFCEGRWNLVLFAHPKCACTKATVREMHRLIVNLNREGDHRVEVKVLVSTPAYPSAEWTQTSLLQQIHDLPSATVQFDRGGHQSRKFAVNTSGTVMLFGPDRNLRFRGGITIARGHEGDSVGQGSIRALVSGRHSAITDAPAFGCTLCFDERPSGLEDVL